jgi:Tol biopolymer transport system component
MSDRRIPCVAVIVCVLRLGDIAPIACQFAGIDALQFEPTVAVHPAEVDPEPHTAEKFMVWSGGNWLLGPDGKEKEYLHTIPNGLAAISPDERWVAFCEYTPTSPEGKRQGWLVVQSRVHQEERKVVPLIWETARSSASPLWSSDSKRILICEQASTHDPSAELSSRIYEMGSDSTTKVKLPGEWSPSDWSSDCKRVLTSLRSAKGNMGVAWVHIDGTGAPEFLTSDQEVAHGARLSPDNRRILCQIGSRSSKNEASRTRLYVIDLATKQRTVIDKLGHTDSYCWSSDGSKVAYTWQMPLRQPEEVAERKAYLITCDPDGDNRKTITMRKYEVPANSQMRKWVFSFFKVLAWWR